MSFTIKLGHNGHTRRLTHPDPPTWEWLAAKVSELYKIPRDDVALSYVDAEEDQVTLSTQEELEDYFANFHRRGETARFTVQSISTPPVTQQVFDEDEVARDVDPTKESSPLEAEEWHKVDADSKSLDVFGLEGLWGGLGGLNPNYFSIITTPNPPNRFQVPDVILQQPVNLMSPSTATLIRMEGNASDTEGETEKPTPRMEKSKGKEVVLDEHPTVSANVPGAQSLHGTEGEPVALGATLGKMETTMPPLAQPPVEDPPLPTFGAVPVPPVTAPAGGAPGPPDPTAASADPPNAANAAHDVAALLQALTTAFITNPELAEGVRKIIRLATDPTYFAAESDHAVHTANQAIARAVSAAEGGTRGVSEALEGVFDALSSGLNRGPAARDPSGLPPRHDRHPRSGSPPYPRHGRWPHPSPSYLPPLGTPFPLRGFPPPPPPPTRPPFLPHGSGPTPPPPPPRLPPLTTLFSSEQDQYGPYNLESPNETYNVASVPEAGPNFRRRGPGGPRMNRHTRPQTVPFGYAPHYETPAGAPPGAIYGPGMLHGNQPEITVQTPAQEAPAVRPYDDTVWRTDAPPQTQLQQVPATVANSKEEALLGLSERKTQLEIAKEKYRIEKQKWKEEKEARRLARDREIERLTGRRVLSREERRRERERRETEGDHDIPQINARSLFPGEHEYNPDQKHPMAGDLPTDRDERPEHVGDTVVPDGRFGPKPTNTKTPAPPPYPSRLGATGLGNTADKRALELFDRLEDMGFSPSTHPRMREIVTEQLAEIAPEVSDDAILPRIMEAIVSLAPSGSGTHGRKVYY